MTRTFVAAWCRALDDRFLLDAITHGIAYARARREQLSKPLVIVPASADTDLRAANLAKAALAVEIGR